MTAGMRRQHVDLHADDGSGHVCGGHALPTEKVC